MDYVEVERLADQLRETLENELQQKKELLDNQEKADRIKAPILAAAVASGALNGKNQRTRDAQGAAILLENGDYQFALSLVAIVQFRVDAAALDRKHAEALISLTKAWLYSQQGATVINARGGKLQIDDIDHDQLMECTRDYFSPSDVFPDAVLIEWAEGFGFVTIDVPETGPGRKL